MSGRLRDAALALWSMTASRDFRTTASFVFKAAALIGVTMLIAAAAGYLDLGY